MALALVLLAGCRAVPPGQYPSGEGDLLVRFGGFRNDRGVAIASLFAGDAGFPEEITAARATITVPVRNGAAEVVFAAVPYGEYAICVLHDEDGDGRMATGPFGAPLEGFGFSGQPDYRFGPPSFAKTRFLLLSPRRELEIPLRYETGRREHRESGQSSRSGRSTD